jgi:hypothetical protein
MGDNFTLGNKVHHRRPTAPLVGKVLEKLAANFLRLMNRPLKVIVPCVGENDALQLRAVEADDGDDVVVGLQLILF